MHTTPTPDELALMRLAARMSYAIGDRLKAAQLFREADLFETRARDGR